MVILFKCRRNSISRISIKETVVFIKSHSIKANIYRVRNLYSLNHILL